MTSSGLKAAILPAFKADSFPSIDDRVGWILSLVCILIALLLTIGILRVEVGPVSGAALLAIAAAQFAAAFVIAALTRRRSGGGQGDAPAREESAATKDGATVPPA